MPNNIINYLPGFPLYDMSNKNKYKTLKGIAKIMILNTLLGTVFPRGYFTLHIALQQTSLATDFATLSLHIPIILAPYVYKKLMTYFILTYRLLKPIVFMSNLQKIFRAKNTFLGLP